MGVFIVAAFIIMTVVIPLVLGIKALIKESKFWKRQNYMSKINKD